MVTVAVWMVAVGDVAEDAAVNFAWFCRGRTFGVS